MLEKFLAIFNDRQGLEAAAPWFTRIAVMLAAIVLGFLLFIPRSGNAPQTIGKPASCAQQ